MTSQEDESPPAGVTPQREVPAELAAMLDADAGKAHSSTGPALASLARILARYDEIKGDEVKRNLATLNEIVMELVDGVSPDLVFRETARSLLREHSRQLGFKFQGEH